MARICQICSKEYKKGNLVARGIGNRVSRRTSFRQQPNLRSKRIEINGKFIRIRLCSSCLKRLKYDAKNLALLPDTVTK